MADIVRFPFVQLNRQPGFIGRRGDLQCLMDMVLSPSVRLITIIGSGGIGKTRLAIELLEKLQGDFAQGVHFIPLAQLNTVPEILPAIAERLDIQSPPNGNLKQALLEHIAAWQVLIVLDNFEQLLDGALLVNDLLAAGPQLKFIVTSREKLNLQSEVLYPLKGLPLAAFEDLASTEQCEAVQLFVQKSRQVRPGFLLDTRNVKAVHQLCQFVNGAPLGILLSAAWIEHFSPAEILDQVRANSDFLFRNARDADPRHSSMRAVFTPSFERLSTQQKAVFRRLAYFHAGFDLEAAQAIAEADLPTLIALVERSLLSRDLDSGRYELHELLRQYAHEQLNEAGESEKILSTYTTYYRAFVEQRERGLIGPTQNELLDDIQADFDNIRQAFTISVNKRDFDTVRAMLPGLYKFCDMRSRAYEAEILFRLARDGLAPQAGEAPQPAWALTLLCWYDMRAYGKPFERMKQIPVWARDCLKWAEAIHDPQAMAASLTLLGAFEEDSQDFKTAIRHYKRAIQAYPLLDNEYWINIRIGLCHLSLREYSQAIRAFRVSYDRGVATGERLKQGWSLANIGDAYLQQSKPQEARRYLEQACDHFQVIGNKFGFMWANHSLGRAAQVLRDHTAAMEHAEIAGRLAQRLHATTWIAKVEALMQELESQKPTEPRPTRRQDDEGLSQREMEILQLLKSELTGPEIAEKLIVSINTVRFHTKNIYGKLGVNNRLEAIRRAKELGL